MKTLGELEKLAELFASSAKKSKKTPKGKDRGDVCFPANSKHNKGSVDKFPINSENQARNALSRAGQFDKAPPWFFGTLEQLKSIVRKKVHSKYKGIEVSDLKKSKKKSSIEVLLEKYSSE